MNSKFLYNNVIRVCESKAQTHRLNKNSEYVARQMDATFIHIKDIACKSKIYMCVYIYQQMLPVMHPKLWGECLEQGNLNHQGISIAEYAKKKVTEKDK